jgi:hypothetical protein
MLVKLYETSIEIGLSIHVMFYDVFSVIHVLYMRCSIMYLVLFYGISGDVHLFWR